MPEAADDRAPLWARGERTAQRRSLDRAAIVKAAISLADREGLDAVSIRRIAGALEARPMTLYRHVPSKGDLLDLMFDELAGEALLADSLPKRWREALTAIAARTRDIGLAHPWSLQLLGQRAQVGPNTLAVLDEWLRAVREARARARGRVERGHRCQ